MKEFSAGACVRARPCCLSAVRSSALLVGRAANPLDSRLGCVVWCTALTPDGKLVSDRDEDEGSEVKAPPAVDSAGNGEVKKKLRNTNVKFQLTGLGTRSNARRRRSFPLAALLPLPMPFAPFRDFGSSRRCHFS